MRVFLVSDLVVQELASMHVDGKWLSPAQFAESALLWISRFAPGVAMTELLFHEIECDVLSIAMDLLAKEAENGEQSQMEHLFRDYPTVNYAHPLSAKALALTLASCREKIARGQTASAPNAAIWARQFAACTKHSAESLNCDSAACQLTCLSVAPVKA